jgi:MoxR-like ATPase
MPLHSQDDPVTDTHKITDEEYASWGKKIDEVIIPKTILNVIHSIRDAINQFNQKEENLEHQLYVSDQRWHKIMHLLRTSAFLNDRDAVDPMDCFLITHCIWNEREHINQVAQFVHEAIEQHGYSLSGDFSGIKQQIAEFRTVVHENTFVMKSTKVTVLETVYDDYYEILKPPAFAHLIKRSDFQNLSDEHRRVTLYYWNDTYKQVQSAFRSSFASGFSLLLPKPGQVMLGACLVKKGDSEFSIFLDDTEYQLKTIITEEKQQVTKKPSPKVKEAWDKQVADLAQHIKAVKDHVERHQNIDREHFRTHLFVKPELAAVFEPHLDPIFKDIEDMDREIRAIQDLYKSPKRKKST